MKRKKNTGLPVKEVKRLVESIRADLDSKEYKRPFSREDVEHFENGHYLHSSQYFFAKKYFQSSNNCDKIVVLLANKIKELDLKNTTLIGFRSYIGLLLSKTQSYLAGSEYEIDYAIVEQKEETEFTWQFIPDFSKIKKNLVIVLPITCTCSTYERLRIYLDSQLTKLRIKFGKQKSDTKTNWKINDQFINIFFIQHEDVLLVPKPIVINKKGAIVKVSEGSDPGIDKKLEQITNLYGSFNWERIENEVILINKSKPSLYKVRKKETFYIANPLINLYSKLFLPETCPLCFPENGLEKEENIFPTHNNFETPNLLIGFPNFGMYPVKSNIDLTERASFKQLFNSSESLGSSHLYGHIRVNKNSYLHYIRGNTFYQHNKENILKFFSDSLHKIFTDNIPKNTKIKDVVFITSEGKHNSSFLDEIATRHVFSVRKEENTVPPRIHILRYDTSNELIDNFMTNYEKLLGDDSSILTIFFEDVISAGKTFKLLSNYLKHYRHKSNLLERKQKVKGRQHGFDYIFALIDRTPFYTRKELLKKLISTKVKNDAENNFISYFRLNVPIFAAANLGNPLVEKVEHLKLMVKESHLDALKAKIASELPSRVAIELPEENILINKSQALKYFPFEDDKEDISKKYFETYKALLSNGKLDLLKLYVTHRINLFLSNQNVHINQSEFSNKIQSELGLIENIIKDIWADLLSEEINFFSNEIVDEKKNLRAEWRIVHDTIIKILSRHPFTYYKDIYDSIFKYCLESMEFFRKKIENPKGVISYNALRYFKFYVRRLVELDSSYLISKDFLKTLKVLFEQKPNQEAPRIIELKHQIEKKITTLKKRRIEQVFYTTKLNNLYYKYNQIDSLLLFLIYSFKESVFKNHYRSIKLESLLNSQEFLPSQFSDKEDDTIATTLQLIKNSYYLLTGIIKAENIYLLNQLKNYHKKEFIDFLKKEEEINAKIKNLNTDEKALLLVKLQSEFPFDSAESISKHYFEQKQNAREIINATKFISNSRYSQSNSNELKYIKLSIAEMLRTATLLMTPSQKIVEKSQFKVSEPANYDFLGEIKHVIQSVVRILQHGIEKTTEFKRGRDVAILPGSKESKLKYALCFEYLEKNSTSENDANNIFVISSEESKPGVKLDPNGLIYNLLYGLYSSKEVINETKQGEILKEGTNKNRLGEKQEQANKIGLQSLLVSIQTEGRFESFVDEFYPLNSTLEDKPLSFNELCKKDKKFAPEGTGLSILNTEPMALFFRLSDLDIASLNNDRVNLKGRAVLVVTCSDEPIKSNYLKFMSNEKIRLLMLIKEELLQYLQEKFASSAFSGLLKNIEENKELEKFQRHIKHGIGDYIKSQARIVQLYERIEKKRNLSDDANDADYEIDSKTIQTASSKYKEFFLINKLISGQIRIATMQDSSVRTLFSDYLFDIVKTIYNSEAFGKMPDTKHKSKPIHYVNKEPFTNIRIPSVVMYCVIPEILINQKKYGSERKIDWKETSDFLELYFINKIAGGGYGYGQKMCKDIQSLYKDTVHLEFFPPNSSDEAFTVKLKFFKK